MPTNCAWCFPDGPGDEIGSHGICQPHADEQRLRLAIFRALGTVPERVQVIRDERVAQQLGGTVIAGAMIDGQYTVKII